MSDSVMDGVPLDDSGARAGQHRAELFERMRKTPTCLLITHDAAGGMHVRPMTTQTVDVKEGTQQVKLTVGKDWGTGAYVLATLRRPLDAPRFRTDHRSSCRTRD